MDKSDILSRICSRYPARLYLTFVGGRSVYIQYGENLDTALKERLSRAISQLPLDRKTNPGDAELKLTLSMEPCPGEASPMLCLRCGDQRFFYPEPASEDGVMWTLYVLVRALPSLEGKTIAKLRAVTYSADQQALAARLLNSADYWQQTLSAEVLPPVLEKAVRSSIGGMLSHAPRFSERPLTAGGHELVQSAAHRLRAPLQQIKRGELARRLYGDQPFEQDLDAWCRMLQGKKPFREALMRAEMMVSDALFHLPMMESVVRLRDAAQELSLRFDTKEDQRRLAEALDAPGDYKRLPREQIKQIFAEVDRIGKEIAEKKLSALLLKPLAMRLRAREEEVIPTALDAMREWNCSLREFCRVAGEDDRLNIGWDRCGELRDEDLMINENGWSGWMLRRLYTGIGARDGYYVINWFCSRGVYELARDHIEQMSHEMTPLPGMTEKLVVALQYSPIREDRAYE